MALYLVFASSVQARLTESAYEGCTTHTHTRMQAEHLRTGDGVPRKDRCLVNVVRYMPADVAEFCHTRSQLGLPHTGG